MDYQEILKKLAPCGLDCSRCVNYAHGEVKELSGRLGGALQGFDKIAAMVKDWLPVMNGYPQFAQVLEFYQQASCKGCRAGGFEPPFCAARTCFREKGVDFCSQCDEYPCGKNQYPEDLAAQWRANNDRMKEVGVEAFYGEQKLKPRY